MVIPRNGRPGMFAERLEPRAREQRIPVQRLGRDRVAVVTDGRGAIVGALGGAARPVVPAPADEAARATRGIGRERRARLGEATRIQPREGQLRAGRARIVGRTRGARTAHEALETRDAIGRTGAQREEPREVLRLGGLGRVGVRAHEPRIRADRACVVVRAREGARRVEGVGHGRRATERGGLREHARRLGITLSRAVERHAPHMQQPGTQRAHRRAPPRRRADALELRERALVLVRAGELLGPGDALRDAEPGRCPGALELGEARARDGVLRVVGPHEHERPQHPRRLPTLPRLGEQRGELQTLGKRVISRCLRGLPLRRERRREAPPEPRTHRPLRVHHGARHRQRLEQRRGLGAAPRAREQQRVATRGVPRDRIRQPTHGGERVGRLPRATAPLEQTTAQIARRGRVTLRLGQRDKRGERVLVPPRADERRDRRGHRRTVRRGARLPGRRPTLVMPAAGLLGARAPHPAETRTAETRTAETRTAETRTAE